MFDRFSIMRHWSDVGDFDLFGSAHGYGMAKRVHDCIGRSLSGAGCRASRLIPPSSGFNVMKFNCRFAVAALAAAVMCGSAAVHPAFAQAASPEMAAKSDTPPRPEGSCDQSIEAAKSAAQGAGGYSHPCAMPAGQGPERGAGIVTARRASYRGGRAGHHRRFRLVDHGRLRHIIAGLYLSEPAGRSVAPQVSDRRYQHHQSRYGRTGYARDDQALQGRGARRQSGSGDLAARHQHGRPRAMQQMWPIQWRRWKMASRSFRHAASMSC